MKITYPCCMLHRHVMMSCAIIFQRGWTAWLLTCTDQRVFATAPFVLSLLNWNEVCIILCTEVSYLFLVPKKGKK